MWIKGSYTQRQVWGIDGGRIKIQTLVKRKGERVGGRLTKRGILGYNFIENGA